MQRIWIWKPFNTRPRIQILCIFTVWKVWKYLVVSVEEIKCHILATSIQSRTLRIQFFLLLNYLVLRQKKYFGVILPSVSFQNVFLQSIFFQTCIFVKYTWLLSFVSWLLVQVVRCLRRRSDRLLRLPSRPLRWRRKPRRHHPCFCGHGPVAEVPVIKISNFWWDDFHLKIEPHPTIC